MERGSEWRKWDLHIHTPETLKNNQFGKAEDAWLKYIQLLEESDIAVYGITDYFSIRNYLKVKEFQKQGRLDGKVILPNVEMRITPVTRGGTPLNIHVIFNPSFSEEELNREFFRKLNFEFDNEHFSCVEEDLVRLGRKIEHNDTYQEKAAIRKAIENFTISYDSLRSILREKFFKDKIIVALANGSNDGLSGIITQDGTLHPIRTEICKMSDVILSGNPSDVEYFLGKKTSIDDIVRSYGSIKPCIMGSDAHSLEQVGKFPNNRITWIKASPTFDGLRQILFEPEDRVAISEVCPDQKFNYNVIDYVDLNTAGDWHQKVYFNQNLNTIIGGRSTGKSTLLLSMAKKLNIPNLESNEFVDRLSQGMKVVWRDGQESEEKALEYFPQNYLMRIAENEYSELLLQILLNDEERKENYENYMANLSIKNRNIQSAVSLYFETRRLYEEKSASLKTLGDLRGVELEIIEFQKKRNEIQARLTDKKSILDVFEQQQKELSELTTKKRQQTEDMEKLGLISEQIFLTFPIIDSMYKLSGKLREELEKVIKDEMGTANQNISTFIKNRTEDFKKEIEEINSLMTQITNSDDYLKGKKVFDENKNLVEIVKKLDELKTKHSSMKKLKDNVNALESEYRKKGQELLDMQISYLDDVNDIASQMIMQCEDIRIRPAIVLKDDLKETLENCLSLRNIKNYEQKTKLLATYSSPDKYQMKISLNELMNCAVTDELVFKNGYDIKTFVDQILSGCWYDIHYDVEYEGDCLKDMSPGKRSFVILKLLLDFSDKVCPILIDQPEDNLDNRDIYNALVKYIRMKKKERQIILVTHNPNIVVGADSEEVIVANQHGAKSPNEDGIRFQYVSGALEDTASRKVDDKIPILQRCGIREHVCDILEGGEEAFKSRENKYGL